MSEDFSEIVKRLQSANKDYREGNPSMSDESYDRLIEYLPEDHWYRSVVESEELKEETFVHPIPMLSTQKAKTDAEVEKWISKIENLSSCVHIRTSAKLDGLAGNYYETGELVTRGNGHKGNIVTSSFKKGVLNISDSYGRGELVMEKDYFEEHLKNDFSHPRNVVVGIVMSDTVNPKLQKALDNNVVHFATYEDIYSITVTIKDFKKHYRNIEKNVRNNTIYPIDGVVVEVVEEDIRKKMGSTDNFNRYQLALKPKDIPDTAKVIDIKWSTGRTGRVTPVIITEPVEIDGAVIRKCTGHNAKSIIDMKIEIGCNILIIRSGGVIPYCEGRIDV